MLPDQSLDHRNDPPQLLVLGHGFRASRPGGLATDVQNSGTLSQQFLAVGQRGIGLRKSAAIAEAVRRNIENPDQNRLLQGHLPAGSLPSGERFRRENERDSLGQFSQCFGNTPGPGENTQAGTAAGDNRPGIAGDHLEPKTTCKRDQGLDGSLVQCCEMKSGRFDSYRGILCQLRFPAVRAERFTHHSWGVERQRRNIHAPAGSAGGAPRIGARAGVAPDLVLGLAGAAAGSAGGRVRGGSGRFLTRRSRSSRSMVSRSSSAWAIRSSSSRFSPRMALARASASSISRLTSPSTICAVRSEISRRWANSRPRKISCSLSPTASGPISSLMPNWVSILRARPVARSMSLPAPVVILSAPNTCSSATRPPKNIARLPMSQSLV